MDLSQLPETRRAEGYARLRERHQQVFERLDGLQERLGFRFQCLELLYESLTHRSALTEMGGPQGQSDFDLPWNERLEFLGDSVLGLAVSRRLMERSESLTEGELSRIRASLVNEEALAEVARSIDLGDCIFLGRGEAKNGGRGREALLADTMEAVIGAVFVDGGYEHADAVVGRLFEKALAVDLKVLVQTDFKTMLQELLQDQCRQTPKYELLRTSGPDHDKLFEVAVKLGEKVLGRGRGASKKRASQAAARQALETLLKE